MDFQGGEAKPGAYHVDILLVSDLHDRFKCSLLVFSKKKILGTVPNVMDPWILRELKNNNAICIDNEAVFDKCQTLQENIMKLNF